jgi:hypothetical protein
MMKQVVLTVLAAVVGYGGWAYQDRSGFSHAVRADAERHGDDAEKIQHPSSWPLEFYTPILDGVADPATAERLVVDEDSTSYFIVPLADSSEDSGLSLQPGPLAGSHPAYVQEYERSDDRFGRLDTTGAVATRSS